MRILLINRSHSIIGGAERVYLNTGTLLEEMGHEVQYFSVVEKDTLPTTYLKYFIKTTNKREADFFTKLKGAKDYVYNQKAYLSLSKLIEECKPDIAHIHLFCGGLSSSILKALKKYNVPIVHTVHDYRLLCPANVFLNSNNEICEKCINKSYIQCSLKTCVDGNFFFSTMASLETYLRKYIINPIDYVDHFIFVSRFSQMKHIEFDQRFKYKSSHLFNFTEFPAANELEKSYNSYYLYFGRLSKEKGIKTLLKAAESTGITLKIVGTGPLFDEISDYSKTHTNIHVLGHQLGESLKTLINRASFIVVPSEWYENNPMTVIEAFALGKPVIGARIGGIPEIISDNETGFLFESRNSDDLISSIQKAKELNINEYNQMSSKARLFAENKFSTDTHYQRLIQIYNQVLEKLN